MSDVNMDNDLNQLAQKAQGGNQNALEQLVRAIQDQVYHLAMRILVNPDDAQEATQEILILVVTRLSTFRGESAFTTWVYRVASNYLLTARRIAARDYGLTFKIFAADLENGLVADPSPAADDMVMLNELRIACTMAMLLCLDMNHRIAYVLGDVLELGHSEAAEILKISNDNFRQRLSRARSKVVAFTSKSCGLANAGAKCSCPRRLPAAKAQGRVQAGTYAIDDAISYTDVAIRAAKVEGALKTLKLQTAIANFKSPLDFGAHIKQLLQAGSS